MCICLICKGWPADEFRRAVLCSAAHSSPEGPWLLIRCIFTCITAGLEKSPPRHKRHWSTLFTIREMRPRLFPVARKSAIHPFPPVFGRESFCDSEYSEWSNEAIMITVLRVRYTPCVIMRSQVITAAVFHKSFWIVCKHVNYGLGMTFVRIYCHIAPGHFCMVKRKRVEGFVAALP